MVLLKVNSHKLSPCEYLLTSPDRSVYFHCWFCSALDSWLSLSFSHFIFFSFLNLQFSVLFFPSQNNLFSSPLAFSPCPSQITLVLTRHFFKLTFPPCHPRIPMHCLPVASSSAKNFYHWYAKKKYMIPRLRNISPTSEWELIELEIRKTRRNSAAWWGDIFHWDFQNQSWYALRKWTQRQWRLPKQEHDIFPVATNKFMKKKNKFWGSDNNWKMLCLVA